MHESLHARRKPATPQLYGVFFLQSLKQRNHHATPHWAALAIAFRRPRSDSCLLCLALLKLARLTFPQAWGWPFCAL